MDRKLGREAGESEKLITYVKDRAGHDCVTLSIPPNYRKNWDGFQVFSLRKVWKKPSIGIWPTPNGWKT